MTLSVLLYNLAGFYGGAGRQEDAVQALEEVVVLDERTGHPDLESDRQALEAARRLAALSPEEREELARAAAAEQTQAAAASVRDQVIEALRQGVDRQALAAVAEEAAGRVADDAELSAYLRAVAAVLRGDPAPEVAPALAGPLAEIAAMVEEGAKESAP